MKKLAIVIVLTILLATSVLCVGATLQSMNKVEFEKAFVNRTLTSIPTDNLNGRTIDNTFSMYLDKQGNIWGKMSQKPANEPQTDKGVYSINDNGTFYITWQHWDGAKKLCGHIFNTDNAYISVDCNKVFHTIFMKDASRPGNHLK